MQTARAGAVAAAAALVLVCPRPAGAWVSDESFDGNKFSDSVNISNQWLPLPPGLETVLDGTVTDADGSTPHRIVIAVSDVTKVIDGVRALVVLERDYSDGQLEEEELAFVAQDGDGTVWNMGEYPEEYQDGKFAGAPSTWIPGNEEARPGIHMQATPEVGTPSYLQGYAPKIEFEDRGQVSQSGQEVCVKTGCYKDVTVVDEWNPADQPADGHQFKYHAPGVGVVQVRGEGGEEQENLELVSHRQMSPDETDKIRARVLQLDQRAYKQSKSAYGNTPPAEPMAKSQPAPASQPVAAPAPSPAPQPTIAPAPQPERAPAGAAPLSQVTTRPQPVEAPTPAPVATPAPRPVSAPVIAPRVSPAVPTRAPAVAPPAAVPAPAAGPERAVEPAVLARTGAAETAVMLSGGLLLALGGLFVAVGKPRGAPAVR